MERPFLQSALRELHVFLRSPRFWSTFAAVVLIFWVTGPYGTAERLAAAPRLGFWLVLHAAAWSIAVLFAVTANILLAGRLASMFLRMLAGSVAAAPAIGLAVEAIDAATFGTAMTPASLAESTASGLLLSVLFCLITWMTMSAEQAGKLSPPAPAQNGSAQADVPLLRRLKPENRGAVLHVTVADHYTEVTTSRGRELVLLRFSDALDELGETPGLQVHRSHFVADAHVERLRRTDGRLAVVTKDGRDIPVSRSRAEAVRARWG